MSRIEPRPTIAPLRRCAATVPPSPRHTIACGCWGHDGSNVGPVRALFSRAGHQSLSRHRDFDPLRRPRSAAFSCAVTEVSASLCISAMEWCRVASRAGRRPVCWSGLICIVSHCLKIGISHERASPRSRSLQLNRKHASGGCNMEELLTVVEARPVRDFVVWLRFSDGLVGEVDLRGRLRGRVFEPLKKIAQFSQLRSSRRFRRLRGRAGPILRQRSSGDVASSTRFSTALLVRRINALASERRRLAVVAGPPNHRMVRTS